MASQEQQYLDEVRRTKDDPHAVLSALHQLNDEVDTIHLSIARIAGVFDALDIPAEIIDKVSDAMAPVRSAIHRERVGQKGKLHAQLGSQPNPKRPAWL